MKTVKMHLGAQAKRQIAAQTEDLTLLWYVGLKKRGDANNIGIYRWRDAKCTAASIGVTGQKLQPTLQAILDINQSIEGPPVAPSRVTGMKKVRRIEPPLEFTSILKP